MRAGFVGSEFARSDEIWRSKQEASRKRKTILLIGHFLFLAQLLRGGAKYQINKRDVRH